MASGTIPYASVAGLHRKAMRAEGRDRTVSSISPPCLLHVPSLLGFLLWFLSVIVLITAMKGKLVCMHMYTCAYVEVRCLLAGVSTLPRLLPGWMARAFYLLHHLGSPASSSEVLSLTAHTLRFFVN